MVRVVSNLGPCVSDAGAVFPVHEGQLVRGGRVSTNASGHVMVDNIMSSIMYHLALQGRVLFRSINSLFGDTALTWYDGTAP